ncbi:MAG: SAM-dependent methyltransferase, partial [Bacteroidales bacterium]|nr:SAM-dependent methyltransferase [Bacteroidales bacterium]
MNAPDIVLRKTILTEDGSSTLKLLCYNEQFHSLHGAITEAEHIYINTGLRALSDREPVNLLEVGLGTGLNALLTLHHASGRTIYYHAIEAYPLTAKEIQSLNYVGLINPALSEAFQA